MAGGAKKAAGWLWAGAFYALVLVAGVAMVGGGVVLATFALGVLQSDAPWHLISGIALVVAGGVVVVCGAILLYRIIDIPVPGRRSSDNADVRPTGYYGYTDGGIGAHSGSGHHGGNGGSDGGSGGGN